MDFMITEVQMLIAVLMGLMTIVLLFFLPRRNKAGKVFDNARKMLACGTFLLTVHFMIQYEIHKPAAPSPVTRTIINLMFGIPLSYFVNLSILYLQRRCKIKLWEWLCAPVIFVISSVILLTAYLTSESFFSLHQATVVLSMLYGISLAIYRVLQIIEYFRIKKIITQQMDSPLEELNRWTRWVIITNAIMNVGFPIMTFSTNLDDRAFYGMLSLFIFFFSVFSFMGYGFYSASQFVITEKLQAEEEAEEYSEVSEEEKEKLLQERLLNVDEAAERMIKDRYFVKTGLTMKDVADYMGISRNMLVVWLQRTKYKQFNHWLMALRINEAQALMSQHPDWSNETVAKACGFSDRSYFQRQFRNVVGVTPTRWIEDNVPGSGMA